MKDFDIAWEELEKLKKKIKEKMNHSIEQVCLDALMMMLLTTEEIELES